MSISVTAPHSVIKNYPESSDRRNKTEHVIHFRDLQTVDLWKKLKKIKMEL